MTTATEMWAVGLTSALPVHTACLCSQLVEAHKGQRSVSVSVQSGGKAFRWCACVLALSLSFLLGYSLSNLDLLFSVYSMVSILCI